MLDVQDKVKLADIVVSFVTERFTPREIPVLVGFLTQKKEFRGFQPTEDGHPVLEYQDSYVILITSLDGKTTAQVIFHKEALAPYIDFRAMNFSA